MTIEVKKVTKVSRSRKLPKVIGAISLFAAFSFSGTSALAFEGPGDLGVLAVPSTIDIGRIVPEGDFKDVYSFEVASAASFGSELVSIVFGTLINIDDFYTSLWQGGSKLAEGVAGTDKAGNDTSSLSFSPLYDMSTYKLKVKGTANGLSPLSGVYGGTIEMAAVDAVTPPVPEPEIYALMAVGMGVMGWAARRKKRKQGSA